MRAQLLAGCALAAIVAAPVPALAQLTPGASQVNTGGAAPVVLQAGQTTDITLGAPRTIINWSAYNLTADQTAIYRFNDRGWIVLNKVDGQANIDGRIESIVGGQSGAGNVWFSAPGGVVFGPNANINVGGLLATSAGVSPAFLDAATNSFDFTGGSAGITVQSGAQLRSRGGALALIGGSVTTQEGAAILGAGTSTILYGAANDFTVRFAGQTNGDLDLLDFVVPASGGTASTTPLSLAGQTTGGNVMLAVVNRAEVASAVINAPGVIAAQIAATDGGDVILTAGTTIINKQPGATRLNSTTNTTANFGVVAAARDLLGGFAAPTTLTAAQLTAGRDLGVSVASLDVGALNAGRTLGISADRGITLRGAASAGASASFRTTGVMNVTGAVSASGPLQLVVGSLQAAQLNSGRGVSVSASGAGGVTVGQILVEDDVVIASSNATGTINIGRATSTAARGDDLPTGRNLRLTASGAQADVIYGAAGGTPLNGFTRTVLTAGRDVTANVSGLFSLAGGAAGRTFTIRAGDLDLTAPVTAPTIKIESLVGGVTLGGATSGASPTLRAADDGALKISNAEFQNLFASNQLGIYAGTPGGTTFGDIQVLDLNVDPSHVPAIVLAANSDHDVNVSGVFAPTVSGGALIIGDAGPSDFLPGRILVSGSIGVSTGNVQNGFTGVRGFDSVALNAVDDVILGSARFIALITSTDPAQIDLNKGLPAGVAPTPDEVGRVYLTAGTLRLSAPQRIVQANTGTLDQPGGLYLSNIDGSPVDTLLTVTPAQVVDLFGTLRDSNGVLRSGAAAGRGRAVAISLDGGFADFRNVRVNGFSVGLAGLAAGAGGGGGAEVITASAQQATAVVTAVTAAAAAAAGDADAGESAATSVAAAISAPPPQVMAVAPPPVDEVLFESINVGSGSEELWRNRRVKK